jgi:hypothetical protein
MMQLSSFAILQILMLEIWMKRDTYTLWNFILRRSAVSSAFEFVPELSENIWN